MWMNVVHLLDHYDDDMNIMMMTWLWKWWHKYYDDDINDDDDCLMKVCVVEAPANEENELDTLLLLGQVFLMRGRAYIT